MSSTPIDLAKIASDVVRQLFSDARQVSLGDKTYPIINLKRVNLRSVTIEGFQFLEQNAAKDSKWAQMAREGHQIAWVFKDRKYYARVVDGEYTLLKKNAK
jgi:hypothetical protein